MSGLRLYLLRHAKSSWAEPGMADFDRPLAERGHLSATAMGHLMTEEAFLPELLLCSTAQRTRETLAYLLAHFRHEMTVRLTRGIYEASADDLLGLIRQWGGTARSLLLIGHNPAIEELAQSLAPSGDEPALTRLAAKFPTAALAVIDFGAAQWSEIGSGAGRLAAYHTPE